MFVLILNEILINSFKEFLEQVQRNLLVLTLLFFSILMQCLSFAGAVDKHCGRQKYQKAKIHGQILDKHQWSDQRKVRLLIRDDSLGKFLLDFVELPWEISNRRIRIGDEILGSIKYRKICSSSFFSYDNALKRKGYRYIAYAGELDLKQRVELNLSPKEKIINTLDSFYSSSSELSVLLASTLAEKSRLDEETKEIFRKTGTAHLLVVSGFHVGLIYLIVFNILSFLFKKINRLTYQMPSFIPAAIISMIATGLYLKLISGGQTAVRAILVLFFVLLAKILSRKISSIRNVLFVALLIIWIYPGCFLEASFQLSFAAIFGILCALKIFKPWINYFKFSKILSTFTTSFFVSTGAAIFTWPITYLWFGELVLLSPIYNAIITPIFSILVIAFGNTILLLFLLFPETLDEPLILLLFITKLLIKFIQSLL